MALATATKRPEVQVSYEPRPGVPQAPVVLCFVPEPGEGADLIRAGVDFAARLGAKLVLVHVEPAPLIAAEPQIAFASPQPDGGSQLRGATRELARIADAAGAGEETRIHAAFGDAERSLLELAEREAAAFLLVGSRRFSRSMVERAPCPVLVIPDAPVRAADGATSSILCGIDGSDDARLALRAAVRLSAQLDARLVVAHVGEPAGRAARLADLADEEDAELIVVGSRGHGPFKAVLLGSVSTDLIGVARRPVLVVPPGAQAGAWSNPTLEEERGHAAVH